MKGNGDGREIVGGGSMSDRKVGPVRLSELADGQEGDCFALLVSKEERRTRTGDPYFQLTFRDRGREVKANVWNNSAFFAACGDWKGGDYYKLRGLYTVHPQWGAQIALKQMRPVTEADRSDGFDPAEFTEGSRFD